MNKTAVIVAIVAGIYLFPSMVAAVRRHPAWRDIVALNITLGWIGFGWIAAAIWAFSPKIPKLQVFGPSQGSGAP